MYDKGLENNFIVQTLGYLPLQLYKRTCLKQNAKQLKHNQQISIREEVSRLVLELSES